MVIKRYLYYLINMISTALHNFLNKIKLTGMILDKTGVDIRLDLNKNHYFKKEFERIFSKKLYSEYKPRLMFFLYFLDRLVKIKDHSNKNFNQYIRKLSNDGDNIVGEKFEILTYTRLLQHGISFSKPSKNPDFEIKIGEHNVFIECTSKQAKNVNFFNESIKEVIEQKQLSGIKQGYANLDTVLHVDITKTIYNTTSNGGSIDYRNLMEILEEMITKVDYGGIVLINYIEAAEDAVVYGTPVFLYNEKCNPGIIELHSKIWDLQQKRITPVIKEHL
jgi:hypothetical protein